MFVGHLAVALGAKRVEPRLPLGAAVAAAFGLDLLWPLFLLVGAETVQVRAHDTAFTNLAFESYPWSHSLLLVLGWSVAAGIAGAKLLGSRRIGILLGALVSSHWLLDWVTHRPDLPLWPGGPMAGLGLWNSVAGTYVVEGTMLVAGVGAYLSATRATGRAGSVGFFAMAGLCLLLWATQPWSPPPPSATAVAWGTLILWILPPWSRWIDRNRLDVGESEDVPGL